MSAASPGRCLRVDVPDSLSAVNASRLNARSRQRIDLLVEGVVSGADSGVAELGSGHSGCGVNCHTKIASELSERVNMRQLF
jgi:hypothetical protein